MEQRAHFLQLYYSRNLLSPIDFPSHQDIRCHALKDGLSVIFYNQDTGAVSSTLISLNELARNPTVITRFTASSAHS